MSLENIRTSEAAMHNAQKYMADRGLALLDDQAGCEADLAAVRGMTFREAGIEREGEIGTHRGLKRQVEQGVFDVEAAHAVAVRSLCYKAALARVRAAQKSHSKR